MLDSIHNRARRRTHCDRQVLNHFEMTSDVLEIRFFRAWVVAIREVPSSASTFTILRIVGSKWLAVYGAIGIRPGNRPEVQRTPMYRVTLISMYDRL